MAKRIQCDRCGAFIPIEYVNIGFAIEKKPYKILKMVDGINRNNWVPDEVYLCEDCFAIFMREYLCVQYTKMENKED